MGLLQVRAYRASADGDTWSLIGNSDNPKKVQQWLDEFEGRGLILHSGFSVLPRDVLSALLPSSRQGLVLCAATKAMMGDALKADRISVCQGLEDAGRAPLEAIEDWFFLIPASTADHDEQSRWWLVCDGNESVPAFREAPVTSPICEMDSGLLKALSDDPQYLNVLQKASILSLAEFHDRWGELPSSQAHGVAEALMSYATAPHRGLSQRDIFIDRGRDVQNRQCEAITAMVRYLPSWDAAIPPEPVRIYNALSARGVHSLRELSRWEPSEILRTPNLGVKAMRGLFEYLVHYRVPSPPTMSTENAAPDESERRLGAVEVPSLALESAPDLASTLTQGLESLLAKDGDHRAAKKIRLLRRRFNGETLEQIGETEGVTRERIRQIAESALKDFEHWIFRPVNKTLANLQNFSPLMQSLLQKKDCSQVEFDNLVRIFSERQGLSLGTAQRRYLEKALNLDKTVRIVPFQLASQKVGLPVPWAFTDEQEEDLEGVMPDLLARLSGRIVRDAQAYAKTVFLECIDNPFIASVMAREAVVYRSTISEDGTIAHPVGRMQGEIVAEQMVKILREAGHPLHGVNEIYPRMPKAYRESVNERRVAGHVQEHQQRCSSTSPDYIFTLGTGRYGLWEHSGMSEEHGRRCAVFIEKHLNAHSARQFSDLDVQKVLKKEGLMNWKGSQKYWHRVVSVILMRYRPENVRYMGRFVWTAGPWTDTRDTSGRYHINDLVEEFIKEQKRPVTKQQIDRHIDTLRGRGVGDQYHEKNGLIRLSGTGKTALYWHENADPEPFDAEPTQALRAEILSILKNSSEVFLSGLKADITKNSDIAANYSAMQFLALLLRMPEVAVRQNSQNQLKVSAPRSAAHARQ